ncbi:primase-helicase family protein [Vibrio algicola]|uniref:NrS-1 polymerase-like helicase domain-containing protein n=1 Tax=Vibrio algicola TaxID=2662262 RepID=A0A5Q0THA4_9VIBR|nr:DUF5906 domain-containing protein [Vibrio algicola]
MKDENSSDSKKQDPKYVDATQNVKPDTTEPENISHSDAPQPKDGANTDTLTAEEQQAANKKERLSKITEMVDNIQAMCRITNLRIAKGRNDLVPVDIFEAKAVIDKVMGGKYAKAMIGGAARIIEHSSSDLRIMSASTIINSFSGLKLAYWGVDKEGDPKLKYLPAAKYFIEQSDVARIYESVAFNPNEKKEFRDQDRRNTLNLFQGFPHTVDNAPSQSIILPLNGFEGLKVQLESMTTSRASMRFFEHVHDNICNSDYEAFKQFVAWMANIIQDPAKRPQFAPVLRSAEKGTGKSTVMEILCQVVGVQQSMMTSDAEHIWGRFVAGLINKLLVVGEEISWGGNKKSEGVLKDSVTGNMLVVERKGVDMEMHTKYYRLALLSNDAWVVPASNDERRYLVLDVNPQKAQNKEYFAPFYSGKTKHGGFDKTMLRELTYIFSNLDISNIDLTAAVKTDGLKQQQAVSVDHIVKWWANCLETGYVKYKDEGNATGIIHQKKPIDKVISPEVLKASIAEWIRASGGRGGVMTSQQLRKELDRVAGGTVINKNVKINGVGVRGWLVPNHKEAIAFFVDKFHIELEIDINPDDLFEEEVNNKSNAVVKGIFGKQTNLSGYNQ